MDDGMQLVGDAKSISKADVELKQLKEKLAGLDGAIDHLARRLRSMESNQLILTQQIFELQNKTK